MRLRRGPSARATRGRLFFDFLEGGRDPGAAEIFLREDVGGDLRPGVGDHDVLGLENSRAVGVVDFGLAGREAQAVIGVVGFCVMSWYVHHCLLSERKT